MPDLVFFPPDRAEISVACRSGDSLLQAALLNGVDGFKAECSGMAICATCHVYVSPTAPVNPIDEIENETLELAAAERTPESRLACQIQVTDEMDGLHIRIPEFQ